ncbi:CATRA system-associated protein [Streptomyces aquilus]|uniref:CATRA system-associated protein n=1 Tax=Streptomyces aquilus TaxID=2548456 RepID=UPI003687A9E4
MVDEALADAALRARDVLELVPDWASTPEQWQRVVRALDQLEDAVDRRDATALRASVDALEDLDAYRDPGRVGETPPGPPPPPVLERVTKLVDRIGRIQGRGHA